MDYEFQVVDFEYYPAPWRTGFVTIKYGVVLLLCEVVYIKSKEGFFIRMPQRADIPSKPNLRINVVHIKGKESSDKLQEQVKGQLKENYPEALKPPPTEDIEKFRIAKAAKKEAKNKKEDKSKDEKPLLEKEKLANEQLQVPKPKARSQSKFSKKLA